MDDGGIYVREAPYLDRHVQLGHASGKLLSVSFPTEPDDGANGDHPLLDRIGAYLEGASDGFADVAVALTLPTVQRAVLETLRGVPYGENATVAQLARTTSGLNDDDEADVQLVREALAANPAPLVIGDHRVRDGPSAAPPGVEQRLRSLEGL